jgi:hypothetical protein
MPTTISLVCCPTGTGEMADAAGELAAPSAEGSARETPQATDSSAYATYLTVGANAYATYSTVAPQGPQVRWRAQRGMRGRVVHPCTRFVNKRMRRDATASRARAPSSAQHIARAC